MTIEIYRIRRITANQSIADDKPCTIYNNVSAVQITPNYIYGDINGEQLTIKADFFNYSYTIIL